MSPEQAMGDRILDARSDVYSLAAVVYEMLAGEPPYTGPTAQAIVAKVITEKPVPVTVHRDTVPPHVAAAIQKALAKLPADRFHSAAEFAEALVRPGTVPTPLVPSAATLSAVPGRFWRDRRAAVLMGATALAAIIALWGWLRPERTRPVARFALTFPKGQEVATDQPGVHLALSPDGTRLVYMGSGTSGQPQLFLRPLDQINATPLSVSERGSNPTFSPDGQSVVFSAPVGILKVVSLAGGPPIVLTDSAVPAVQASWGPDGWVYYARSTGLWRVRASGGPSQPVGIQDSTAPDRYRWVDVLPNGKGAVLTQWRGNVNTAGIGVLDFRTGRVRTLLPGAYARYVPSGHVIVALADGGLVAAPFDQDRLAITGPATPLFEGVVVRPGAAAELTVSGNGTLLYMSGAASTQELVWVTRNGTEQAIDPTLRRSFGSLAISPDGTHVVVSITDDATRTIDLWVYDLRQRTLSRLTFESQLNDRPTWTPDGRRITFVSDRKGGRALYTVPWDGSGPAESLLTTSRMLQQAEWSRDGRFLVYRDGPGGRTGRDILYLRPGVDSAPHPFVASEFDESSPALSPDSRWLAYVSDETGRNQVYVRPFPGSGGRWQISTDGGTEPLWAPDGRGIYYRTPAAELMRADVQTRPAFGVGARRRLFSTAAYTASPILQMYALSPDGSRFLFQKGEAGAQQLIVVVNWFEELKRRTSGGSQ
jgi:serine/threonine-protein kinase